MTVRRSTFDSLEGPELDVALRSLEGVGYDPAEFVFETRGDHYPRGSAGTIISVKRLTTGVQRQYGTGRSGGWPYEFERDIRKFFYGSPGLTRDLRPAGD